MSAEDDLVKLGERVALQEWALKILTHYMRHDVGWEARVQNYLSEHQQRTLNNSGISQDDREENLLQLSKLKEILWPHGAV